MAEVPLSLMMGMVVLAAGVLVPNHYLPWTSFHAELTSAVGFAIVVSTVVLQPKEPIRCTRPALALLALAAIPALQWASGRIHFGGDALMATLYLASVAFGFAAGRVLAGRDGRPIGATTLWVAMLVAAIMSVGLALYQWLGLRGLGVLAMDMPPFSRPYANLAQPNHLATLLLMGIVVAVALCETRVIGRIATSATVAYLTFGIAATQSRSAWLGAALLVIGMLAFHRRASLRTPKGAVLAWAAGFAGLVSVWPILCNALYLFPSRSLAEQASGGTRPLHWASMCDAISREPWLGYGWNQVSVALARVAADHPFSGEMIEHSHSLLLDLLVWNGVPLGAAIIAALVWWGVTRSRECRDPVAAMLLLGIGVPFAHAMVEFPLEYAYFLLPVSLMVGMVDGRVRPHAVGLRVPAAAAGGVVAVAAATLATLAVEYLNLEQAHRELRFQSAQIGDPAYAYQEPHAVLLTQLLAFLQFARTPASERMSDAELDRMRDVAERYQYPPVLFRYALAAALNGRTEASRDAMIRLCRIHLPARCTEGLQAWQGMIDGRYPQLRSVDLTGL